eukprot:CAMPEP_0169421468 /NCGR_PEP_ID=MMETSP1017-20121227/66342_1 /TAXON_ID=342587 /ORGANISM="Karlodinium micrum, Strain CCMP2283" /LENGTH=48 /DNA_ID= /DNA_START= /DNA_END= /DNA_ORIENTATION=
MAFQIVIGKAAANKTNKSDELRHKFAWDASRARQTNDKARIYNNQSFQ